MKRTYTLSPDAINQRREAGKKGGLASAGKSKTMTDAALLARQENAKKGGRKAGNPPSRATLWRRKSLTKQAVERL